MMGRKKDQRKMHLSLTKVSVEDTESFSTNILDTGNSYLLHYCTSKDSFSNDVILLFYHDFRYIS